MSEMNKDKSWIHPNDPGILRKKNDPDTDLLVFGYSCTLFRDNQKALEMDQGKQLIPWNNDQSLKIDRYDARGYLNDLSAFENTSYDYVSTPEEREIERLCDEERYRALHQNEEEQLMYQEEEFKRSKDASSNKEYGQVSYQYADDSQPSTSKLETSLTPDESDPFIPNPLLEIPALMIVPATKKENQIIEKTASYIALHGPQVEIIVKARQANNEKLGFMHAGSSLNPYYNFILENIKTGRYKAGGSDQPDNVVSEDALQPVMPSTTVESAPSIPLCTSRQGTLPTTCWSRTSAMFSSVKRSILNIPHLTTSYEKASRKASKPHLPTSPQATKAEPPNHVREMVSKIITVSDKGFIWFNISLDSIQIQMGERRHT